MWAGCTLALLSYFLLHSIATQPVTAAVTPGQFNVAVTQTIWRTLAMFGQYFLPVICLIGAAISAFKRRQRQSLLSTVANSNAADALDGISWQEFEMLVGEAFRLRGYQVTENGGGGADGGVDLVLRKDLLRFLDWCAASSCLLWCSLPGSRSRFGWR
jgi:restriction system protein